MLSVRGSSVRHRELVVYAALALGGCGSAGAAAKDELVAHRWALSTQDCADDYVQISDRSFVVHHPGATETSMPVLRLVSAQDYPKNVMVVVGPPGATPASVQEADRVAFVFEVADGRMRLVAGGSPSNLQRMAADNPNVVRLNRLACT